MTGAPDLAYMNRCFVRELVCVATARIACPAVAACRFCAPPVIVSTGRGSCFYASRGTPSGLLKVVYCLRCASILVVYATSHTVRHDTDESHTVHLLIELINIFNNSVSLSERLLQVFRSAVDHARYDLRCRGPDGQRVYCSSMTAIEPRAVGAGANT